MIGCFAVKISVAPQVMDNFMLVLRKVEGLFLRRFRESGKKQLATIFTILPIFT
tara:strand:+ start:2439 stop:2600 length:162 start_codon:yes stop_codon:yes gene_type:complete